MLLLLSLNFFLKLHCLLSPLKRPVLWLQIEQMKGAPHGVTESVQFILYAACSNGPLKLQCLKYLNSNSSHLFFFLLIFTAAQLHQMDSCAWFYTFPHKSACFVRLKKHNDECKRCFFAWIYMSACNFRWSLTCQYPDHAVCPISAH